MDFKIETNMLGFGTAPDIVKPIDLGLPSGTKWANANLTMDNCGRNKVGDKFSWGETFPKEEFNKETYVSNCEPDSHLTGFYARFRDIGDEKDRLLQQYDAAAELWKGKWRIPSLEQWKELKFWCEMTSIRAGRYGFLRFTSKINSNFIIIPKAEWTQIEGGKLAKYTDGYWSRTYALKDLAWCFDVNDWYLNFSCCYAGKCIRPIWEEDAEYIE